MAREHDHSSRCGCCASMDRRNFMATIGLSALATQSGLLAATSALAADGPAAEAKPRVCAAFLRPLKARGGGWPGMFYSYDDAQAAFTKVLTDAAAKLGVELDIIAEPVADAAAMDKVLARCQQSSPDGVILTVLSLHVGHAWNEAGRFVAKRGDVPTIIYSPMGTCFSGEVHDLRKAAKCFVASTQDQGWLATGVRMMRTIWDMKNTRFCIVNGQKTEDKRLDLLGTTFHFIPLNRWTDEFAKQEETSEVRALADEFAQTAKKIVEPKSQDLINAAKNYFVARRIMAAEKCQGISLNCLYLVGNGLSPCPPCMAWQKLNDEGSVGTCECDWNAAISMLLVSRLCGRPGFMQDPVPNTVSGTFMGAHCTSATRLHGFDQPAQPCVLRSHSETNIGISPQVIWPVGEPVTVMKFDGPRKVMVGTGLVVSNMDTPPCGGCRTSVELKMDGVADPRDCKGFHQLFVVGKHDMLLRAYCQLAGIEAVPITYTGGPMYFSNEM
jgi:hypothetical protein